MARPAFQPTEHQRKLVEQLSAFGIRQEDMCVMIEGASGKPIAVKTLRKHFEKELAGGALKANVKAAQALFKQIERGSVPAIIFWLKTRGGWKEVAQAVEVTGKDGGPMQSISTVTNDPMEAAKLYMKFMK